MMRGKPFPLHREAGTLRRLHARNRPDVQVETASFFMELKFRRLRPVR